MYAMLSIGSPAATTCSRRSLLMCAPLNCSTVTRAEGHLADSTQISGGSLRDTDQPLWFSC